MRSQFKLFRKNRFLPLFVTQFLGALNDNIFKNALLALITFQLFADEKTTGLAVNLSAALFIFPFFIFSATAGNLADKYDKALLARKIKIVEVFLMTFSCYFLIYQQLTGLLIILFLMGTQSAFFGPIKYSLLPEKLNKDELVSGNGFFEAGTFLAILLGTIIGTIAYQLHPKYGPISISIVLIICALTGCYASFKIPVNSKKKTKKKLSLNCFRDSYSLIKSTQHDRKVWLIILAISWFFLIGTAFLSQLPSYTKHTILGTEFVLMIFLVLFSIGIGIGSISYHTLTNGVVRFNIIKYSVLGKSLSIVAFAVFSKLYQANMALDNTNHASISIHQFLHNSGYSYGVCISLFFLAIFAGLYIVPLYALLQLSPSQKSVAQSIACTNIISSFFMVLISLVISGLLLATLSLNQIFLLLAISNLFVISLIKSIEKKFKDNQIK